MATNPRKQRANELRNKTHVQTYRVLLGFSSETVRTTVKARISLVSIPEEKRLYPLEKENATNIGIDLQRQQGRRVNSSFIFVLLSFVMKHRVQNIMITCTSKGSRLPNGLFFGSTKPLYIIASLAKTVSCHVLYANARCVKNTRE